MKKLGAKINEKQESTTFKDNMMITISNVLYSCNCRMPESENIKSAGWKCVARGKVCLHAVHIFIEQMQYFLNK